MMIEETMALEEKMAHWVELRDKCNLGAGLGALHEVIKKDIKVFNGLTSSLKNNLGPVDTHRAAITPAARWIAAAKLVSVLS